MRCPGFGYRHLEYNFSVKYYITIQNQQHEFVKIAEFEYSVKKYLILYAAEFIIKLVRANTERTDLIEQENQSV